MNFTELAFNPAMRLNEVVRYSSVYQETDENLAEHIAEVSLMSYFIAQNINNELDAPLPPEELISVEIGERINVGLLLEKCLLHDIDEVITGDIPRNTKYATKDGHHQMEIVAMSAVKLVESTLDTPITEVWSTAKEGPEGLILKIVDMLVVVKKAITEIELRGNLSFLKVVTELKGHLVRTLDYLDSITKINRDELTLVTAKKLSTLVSEAKDEITTIKVKYAHLIDKYMIKENVIEGED